VRRLDECALFPTVYSHSRCAIWSDAQGDAAERARGIEMAAAQLGAIHSARPFVRAVRLMLCQCICKESPATLLGGNAGPPERHEQTWQQTTFRTSRPPSTGRRPGTLRRTRRKRKGEERAIITHDKNRPPTTSGRLHSNQRPPAPRRLTR